VQLPEPRREFSDASRRVLGDALQNIDELGVRKKPDEPTILAGRVRLHS
jgi:hypothetical protein